MSYDDSNVFARILRGELPCHKAYETERVLAFMDVMPRSDGHVLVIPKAKARGIFDIEEPDLHHVFSAVQQISWAAREVTRADGVTIIQSNESAGGQVIFHMHVHVIPRWAGVDMRPHTGNMEDPAKLAGFAELYRQFLMS
jgi:Diadenosine tetraphosphate (Ap4A) hydrolase and other HIT family hydrolases